MLSPADITTGYRDGVFTMTANVAPVSVTGATFEQTLESLRAAWSAADGDMAALEAALSPSPEYLAVRYRNYQRTALGLELVPTPAR